MVGEAFGSLKELSRQRQAIRSFEQMSDQSASLLKDSLEFISVGCIALQMPVAVNLVNGFLKEISIRRPTWIHMETQIKCIEDCFISELNSRLFAFIPIERSGYFSDGVSLGKELQAIDDCLKDRFDGARTDLYEAGNCFAAERYTACVHHLSRCVEFGLISLAEYSGVEKKDQRNWNKALEKCNQNLREKKGRFDSLTPDAERYFSEAIGLLRNFKSAWRNPSSHIPVTFSEAKARGLFSIARSTMEHLSLRLSQVEMPTLEE